MSRNYSSPYTMLDAESTQDTVFTVSAEDYDHIVFEIDTDGGGDANLTVKFAGSVVEDKPDISAAQSVTNPYDFIRVVDYQSGTAINGDTGIVAVNTDIHRLVVADVDGLKWVGVRLTARTAGEVTVKARLFARS